MKIKVEPFIQKKDNRVGKAAIEFDSADGVLAGFYLVGFTICDDKEKGLFVLFPATITKDEATGKNRSFFFLRPSDSGEMLLDKLQDAILDVYESMTAFNRPQVKQA